MHFALLTCLFIAIVIASSEVRFCRADASPDPILDTDGKKLRISNKYYILPAIQGSVGGGGFAIGNIRKEYDRCGVNVV